MWLVVLLNTKGAKVIIAVQCGMSRGLPIPSQDEKSEAKHCCKALPVHPAGPALRQGPPMLQCVDFPLKREMFENFRGQKSPSTTANTDCRG